MRPEPKHYNEYNPVKDTITHVIDYRGSQNLPKRPPGLECDYCSAVVDRLWCRPVRPVGAELVGHARYAYDGGHWCACVYCHPLVEARDIRALVARVKIINPEGAKTPAVFFERLYTVIFAATCGPAVEWQAGEAWPVKLGEPGA